MTVAVGVHGVEEKVLHVSAHGVAWRAGEHVE